MLLLFARFAIVLVFGSRRRATNEINQSQSSFEARPQLNTLAYMLVKGIT
jgi:hypothetical protein